MSNTSYITRKVEPFLVNWVGESIGTPLRKRRIEVGRSNSGRAMRFEFDGVSEDLKVGVLASAGRSVKPGSVRKLIADLAILLACPFEQRVMVFTELAVMEAFRTRIDGILCIDGIQFLSHPGLPEEMRKTLDEVHEECRREQMKS